jgi:ketosteroid isomerase-like protein
MHGSLCWRQNFQAIFDYLDSVHNHRNTVKIEVSPEEDAALAVMDIDSLWRTKDTKQDVYWKGPVCKIYTRMSDGEWKLIFQTGPLDYGLCRERNADLQAL